MKLASFNYGRIGVVDGDGVAEITDLLQYDPTNWPPVGMLRLIANFSTLQPRIADRIADSKRLRLDQVKLNCPVAWPNKIVAFPANYHAHIDEMKAGPGLISKFDAGGQGFFLKASSSLSGPQEPIVLPAISDREVHHECELAIIIGKGGRDIAKEAAIEHIFGYACLVDVVVRGKEERVMRKSFDTFCPMGPYITTSDEIECHDAIALELTINGELRQKANTRDLIVGIPEMIEMASSVMTLHPGDVIASGTPAGVGPIKAGDVLTIRIAGVGEMNLDIVAGASGGHPLWLKTSAPENM